MGRLPTHFRWQRAAVTALAVTAGLAGPAAAGALGTGLAGDRPHVLGTLRPGESRQIEPSLAPLFASVPVRIAIAPDSDPLELQRLSLWLAPLQPSLQVERSCVGACALFILFSAKELEIAPQTVIAFGGMSEVAARLDQQLQAGDLFDPGSEQSQASRQRFVQAWSEQMEQARELQQARSRHDRLPAAAQRFIGELMGGWRVEQLLFSHRFFESKLAAAPGRCLWWIPDAQGLRQLGLPAPDTYKPASRATAARLLHAPEHLIYTGPLPGQVSPRCEAPAGAAEPLLELRP
ncbi:hypothetical protein J7U46_15205 [Pelomonas sp. V22]|uniref:hypothetical protein n=1 Tax=Pelomonas sp. V22 TaxID=2822139 RepID=UPI0024A7F1CC|nr:hypothetical protein [Pelomonas sp. V22]MDI4634405.1 hypothetical protein [Pelomonas sp. V22]